MAVHRKGDSSSGTTHWNKLRTKQLETGEVTAKETWSTRGAKYVRQIREVADGRRDFPRQFVFVEVKPSEPPKASNTLRDTTLQVVIHQLQPTTRKKTHSDS